METKFNKTEWLERLEEYGKVEALNITDTEVEFKITDGFSIKGRNTFKFMGVAQEIAGKEYKFVKKFNTDENLCHLILTKQSKNVI